MIVRPVTCPGCDYNARLSASMQQSSCVLEHLEIRLSPPEFLSPHVPTSWSPWPALQSLSLHGSLDPSIVTCLLGTLGSQLTQLELGLLTPINIDALAFPNITFLRYQCLREDITAQVTWITTLSSLTHLNWKPPLVDRSTILSMIPRVAHVLREFEVDLAYGLNVQELGEALQVCTQLTRITHRAYNLYHDDEEVHYLWLPHARHLRYLSCSFISFSSFLDCASLFTALNTLELNTSPTEKVTELRFPHLTRLSWVVPTKLSSLSELFAFLFRLVNISSALTELSAKFYLMAMKTDADYRSLEDMCTQLDQYSGNLEYLALVFGAKISTKALASLRRRMRWLRVTCD